MQYGLLKEDYFQWDTGQRIELYPDGDDEITELHMYNNRIGGLALVKEVKTDENGVLYAEIPDLLFRLSGRIIFWRVVSNLDGTSTKEVFDGIHVIPRPKPTDYVYEQPDTMSYKELLQKFEELNREYEEKLDGGDLNGKDGADGAAIYYYTGHDNPESSYGQLDKVIVTEGKQLQVGDLVVDPDGWLYVVTMVQINGSLFKANKLASIQGPAGPTGPVGAPGVPGITPVVTTERTTDGVQIKVTDASGETSVTTVYDGEDGQDGNDGYTPEIKLVPVTDGVQIQVYEKNSSSTATIRNGTDGAPGERGTGILNITTVPSSYTTATGGFTPTYRIALSTVLSQSKASKVLVGDTLAYNYYQYPVGYVDSSYVYLGARKSIRGATGSAGKAGTNGKSAYAYAQEGGFDGTEEEFAEKLATEYLEKDEMFYISTTVTPDYTNLIPFSTDTDGSVFNGTGYIADKTLRSDGSLGDNPGTFVSGFIPVKQGDIIRVKDTSQPGFESSLMFCLYSASQANSTGIGKSAGYLNTVYGSSTIEGNVLTWDTSSIGYYPWTNFAYLRVTTFSANAIVTVNEELIESEKDELTLKPEVKVPVDNLSGDLISTPLAGETVVCFGDSLFGMYRDDSSTPAQIASKTGATVYNVGFGGCRMSVHPTSGYAEFSMWALAKAISENNWSAQDTAASKGSDYFPDQLAILKGIDFNAVDSIVIHYGTNDFAAGVAVDNASDPDDYATLCGALRYSIEKLLGAYPKLKIFVSLPVFRYWTASDGTVTYSDTYLANGKTLPVFVEALRSVALEYNLPVIDGYYGLGINKDNASAFLSDGTHHNADGRKRFGEFIGAHLTSFGQTATKSGEGGSASIEVTAEVGQTIIVEEVDAGGKPTKWRAAEYQEKICGTKLSALLDGTFEITEIGDVIVDFPYPITVGSTYEFVWNGSVYTCEAKDGFNYGGDAGSVFFGNIDLEMGTGDTGEPFFGGYMSGTGIIVPLDGSETFTLTISGNVIDLIPTQYLANAFPYYIEFSGSGTTDDPYVCTDTVANVTTIFASGRPLILRKEGLLNDNAIYTIDFTLAYSIVTAEAIALGFYFFDPFSSSATSAYRKLWLVSQSDGTFAVTESFSSD